MKSNGDFIIDLLTSKRLSASQREKIIELTANEYEKNNSEFQRILLEIDGLKNSFQNQEKNLSKKIDKVFEEIKLLGKDESESLKSEPSKKNVSDSMKPPKNKGSLNVDNPNKIVDEKNKSSNVSLINNEKTGKSPQTLPRYIRPGHLYKFLFDYNQNPILKSTCHEVDSNELKTIKEYCGTAEYNFRSHLERIIEEFVRLEKQYFAPSNMKALIRGYITGKDYQGNDLAEGWSSDNIKYNWSHSVIEKYSSETSKYPPNLSKEILRNNKISPCKIDQVSSIINGNTIQTFRELVLHFKNLFHIKSSNSLKDILLKVNELKGWDELIEFVIEDELFPSNIELFTDVDKLIQAYNELIKLIIDKNCEEEKPKVKLTFIQKDKKIEFSIYHLNNKYEKNLTDTLERMGQTYTNLIKHQINGLCNLYLNADFGDNQFARINIWDGSAKREAKKLDEFKGVEHILEFEKGVI